jgi:NTE family protein
MLQRPSAPVAPIAGRLDPAASPTRSERLPLVGLALGGGVARGWAHIGVVQRLQELGVKPDIVCGTSVGALVGGFWLAGQLPALEAWARSLTKRRMLSYFDLVLSGSGLMGGGRLRKTMQKYLDDIRIEDLPGQFVAVTAELATGHETWLKSGPLADAIEAAYALPGVFPPRWLDGRWLIDGALVNPLPVSVCRAMGARVVLAVGLHVDAFSRTAKTHRRDKPEIEAQAAAPSIEKAARKRSGFFRARVFQRDAGPVARGNPAGEPIDPEAAPGVAERVMLRKLFNPTGGAPGLGSVMLSAFNIVMDRVTRARLAGDPPDVMITPQVTHIPLLDFDRADELIKLGRDAVDYSMPRIERAIEMLA